VAAGLHSQLAGILSGVAFAAILLSVTRKASRDDIEAIGRAVAAFTAAFFGLVLAAVEYAVMAGELARPQTSGRLGIEVVIDGAAFAVSILALFYGAVLLIQPDSRLERARSWVELVTATLGPIIALLLVLPGAKDIEDASHEKTSALICGDIGGLQLTGYVVVVVAIIFLILLRIGRARLPVLPSRRQMIPSYVVALTAIVAVASFAISNIYDDTVVPPNYMPLLFLIVSAIALILFSFLVLATRSELHSRKVGDRGELPADSERTGHRASSRSGPPLSVDAAIAEVVLRTRNQGSSHWHEFSVIVAGANILLGLVLAGKVVRLGHFDLVTLASAGIALASAMAVTLAYYSIQVGTLLIFGPLHLTQVLSSFLIAGAQLALFLWPTHVIANGSSGTISAFRGLRQWLIFFAIFAFSAIVANIDAARVRRREGVSGIFKKYESAQRRDRKAALISGSVALIFWLVSLNRLTVGLFLGVVSCATAALLGTASQSRTVAGLMDELPGATIRKKDD
jgi:hypothetical protein